MPSKLNLIGQRYGKLIVTGEAGSNGRKTQWVCQCDCGKEIIAQTIILRHAGKTSCGCDTDEKRTVHSRTHGLSKSPTYKSWIMMKSRCYNKNYTHYKYYGGSGVTVCDEWLKSFATFLKDMGERPAGKTLDRIDPKQPYCKSNCRWATRAEQVENRAYTRHYTYNEETKNLTQWARFLGVSTKKVRAAAERGEGFLYKLIRSNEARAPEFEDNDDQFGSVM
jgi:hypothetical protein